MGGHKTSAQGTKVNFQLGIRIPVNTFKLYMVSPIACAEPAAYTR